MIDRFLRQFTVRARILGGFLTIVLLLALAFPLVVTNYTLLLDRVKLVSEEETNTARRLLQASRHIAISQLNLMRFTQDYAPSPYEATDEIKLATDLLNEALESGVSSKQEESINGILGGLEEYRTLIDEIQTARQSDEKQTATRLESQAYRLGNDMGARLEEIAQQSEDRSEEMFNAIFGDAQNSLRLLIGGMVALVIAAVFSTLLISTSITRPIAELRDGAEAFRQGRAKTNIPEHGADELSALAVSFNRMAIDLSKAYAELEEHVAERTRDLARQTLQLQTAAEIARDAASVRHLEALLDRSVNLIQERFSHYQVTLFLLDEQGKIAVLKAATGAAGQAILKHGFRIKVGEIGIVSSVATSGMPRIVNDVSLDFSYLKHPLLPDTRSEMALPLKVGERIIGVLDLQSAQVNAFDQKELSALQIMSDQLAVAIENARLVEELQGSLQETNVLYQRFAQDSWARAIRSDRPTGYEYDLSQVIPVTYRIAEETLQQIKSGHTVRVKGSENETQLIAPLMVYGQVVGMIGLGGENPQHEWSAEEVTIVETVTHQVALALDNARLLEETQLRSDQLRLLQEITAAAASHVRLDEMLNDVAQRLRFGFDSLYCNVALFDPGKRTTTIVTSASREISTVSPVGITFPLQGNFIIERINQTRKTIVVNDILHTEPTKALQELMGQHGTQTLVVIPLVSRGELIGTITLEEGNPKRKFDNDDLRLMDQISLQIAAAIDVARSFEQAVQRAERERRLSEITGQIRSTLDIDAVIKTAVREVQRSLGLPEVIIRLGTPNAEHLPDEGQPPVA